MIPRTDDIAAVVGYLHREAVVEFARDAVPQPIDAWLSDIYTESRRRRLATVAFVHDDVVRLIDGED